jgi:hypothetical protein
LQLLRKRITTFTIISDPAAGGSIDWVKGVHNTTLTLAFELRDLGTCGFLLPPEQIVPTSLEFMDGFAVIIEELRSGIGNTGNNSGIIKPASIIFVAILAVANKFL